MRAKRILLDVNIIMDLLLARKPFAEDAKALFQRAIDGEIEIYITSCSIRKPELKVTENAFMISLPNLNYKKELAVENSYEHKIIEYLKLYSSINRKDAEQLLDVGQTMAGRILKEMVVKRKLKTEGKAAKIKYLLMQ